MKNLTALYRLALLVLAITFTSCDSEDEIAAQPFVVGFDAISHKYSEIHHQKNIRMVFSETAKADGSVRIRMTPQQATYGVDFSIEPEPDGNEFDLPIYKGQRDLSFVFNNLIYPFDSDEKLVKFEVVALNYPQQTAIQGFTTTVISFDVSLGAIAEPQVGGPNQGNQVYFDLSTETATVVWRDSWDLGFYGGEEFRVGLNASIYMAAKKLDATDIDAVTQASVQPFFGQVTIGTFDPANMAYVDAPSGHITQTAISEISAIEADNHVYLVNLGYTVGTATPAVGTVAIAGSARGWRKIRVTRVADGYRMQYAELNSATHQEVIIPKNAAFNFSFFSFTTNNIVSVEPEKSKWDINFTVFTNENVGAGSYGFSDFVVNNLKAGVKAYHLEGNSTLNFDNYSLANVDDAAFEDDQRVIGADWRNVFTGSVYANKFYIIKDFDGNYYKFRMLGFLNQGGVRGFPKFEYKLLQ